MYISYANANALNLPISFSNVHKMVADVALVDSGATENFLDQHTVRQWGLSTHKLPHPRYVYNVDGTQNQAGTLTEYCVLRCIVGDKDTLQQFYVTNLGKDRVLLGHPWLSEFNSRINWAKGEVQNGGVRIETKWRKFQHPRQIHKDREKEPARIDCTNVAQEWAIKAHQEQRKGEGKREAIPPQYQDYADVFDEEKSHHFPPSQPEDHAIVLKEDAPATINCKVYALTKEEREATQKFIEENEQWEFIEKSNSPWSTSWFFIKKKDGGLRPIQDYREVNSWTIQDVYPIPHIEQILEALHGRTLFTALDIRWGYHNIQICPENQWKAAFKTPFGLYQPKVMLFGLQNSPATFQRCMNRVFAKIMNHYPGKVFVYMDDVLVATGGDVEEHRRIVREILEMFCQESFFLKLSKCKFEQTSIDYLGIHVEHGTIRIDPTKRKGLSQWPRTLSSVKEVRSTLGVLGYQRPFIPHFAHLAAPLTALLKKGQPFKWTDECTKALNALLQIIESDPVLQRPDYDHLFEMEVNTSQYATGAILYQ
jgi:Reverse transcriptase (RNA-dependent DNA polymerase)/RNase H-like domain found in reverse transcriptase